MELDDYLRDLAAVYRRLAAIAPGPELCDEYLDLAMVCEEVANDFEDHLTPG